MILTDEDAKRTIEDIEGVEANAARLARFRVIVAEMYDETRDWLSRHRDHIGTVRSILSPKVIGERPLVLRHMKCLTCPTDNEFKFEVRT